MGFRSTFISEHYSIKWPEWFKTKHANLVNFDGPISSKFESKSPWYDLDEDLHKALTESGWEFDVDFVIIYLHECGGITRAELHKDGVTYTEPKDWRVVECSTHSYCYGCADSENAMTVECKAVSK